MKCDKCDNEAVLHYQSNINGEISEYHLCADCAKKEGFGEMLDFRPNSMFENFFSEPFGGLMSGFGSMPFGGFFGRSLLAPVMTIPQVRIMIGDPEKACETENATESTEKQRDNIPDDAGEEIRSKRELFGLKHQLRSAIRNEEFEKAAELRDKIHDLEKKESK